jgi:uncharacterized membrane protein
MAEVDKEIEVGATVSETYNQWTQFETFPEFMEGVKRVRQLDDKTLEWEAEVAGETKTWKASITDQVPDQRVAWRNTEGTENAGDVQFIPTSDGKTKVKLHMVYETDGLKEKAGDILGVLDRRVEGDLERFKDFMESRGQATGAWRGEVHEAEPRAGESRNPEQS